MAFTALERDKVLRYLGYTIEAQNYTQYSAQIDAISTNYPDSEAGIKELITYLDDCIYRLLDTYGGALAVPHIPLLYANVWGMDRLIDWLSQRTGIPVEAKVFDPELLPMLAQVATPITTPIKSLPLDPYCFEVRPPFEGPTPPKYPGKGQVWLDTSVTPNRQWQWDGRFWVGLTSHDGNTNRNAGAFTLHFTASITSAGTPVIKWYGAKTFNGTPQGIWIGVARAYVVYDNFGGSDAGHAGSYHVGVHNNTSLPDATGIYGRGIEFNKPTFKQPGDQVTQAKILADAVPVGLTTNDMFGSGSGGTVIGGSANTSTGVVASSTNRNLYIPPTVAVDRSGKASFKAREDKNSTFDSDDEPYAIFDDITGFTRIGVALNLIGTNADVIKIIGAVDGTWAHIRGGA